MNALLDRMKPSSPESAARRRFAAWVLGSLLILLPPWWIWGADIAAAVLRPLAGLVMALFGLTGSIDVMTDGGWTVGTRLTSEGQPVTTSVAEETLRRLLLGVPLVVAFLIAPPRPTRPLRAALICVAVTALLFALNVTGFVWGELSPQLAMNAADASAAGVLKLDQPALNPIASQIALMTRYMALSITPLLSAAVLWAVLNPAAFHALAGDIREA